MKKKYSTIIILLFGAIGYAIITLLANYQLNSTTNDNRPHGSQTNLPELTRNNYLMGFLNENRSSYKVSFYDINIDFDIDNKSINGYVTIKAASLNDLNKLQVDLAENLNILKIVHQGKKLDFSRELDAVIIDFPSLILKDSIFNFTIFYEGVIKIILQQKATA